MTKKTRLTLDEHIDMGRVLASIRDELTHRYAQLSNAYPLTGAAAAPARKLNAAIRALDDARNALDDALASEHPEGFQTTVYYPHAENRPPITPGKP